MKNEAKPHIPNDLVIVMYEQNPYNQKPKYLIKSQKLQIHKVCNIKDLKNLQKMVNGLNIRLHSWTYN